ncbi:570_t:CDS:1, partial [Racocetra fulgida]
MNDDNNDFDESSEGYVSNEQNEISDNVSISSSSNASIFNKSQSQVKKIKSKKRRRTYLKPSWVWHYFKVSEDGIYDECQVQVMNFQNESIKCDYKFIHDGSTGNMGNHLRNRHNLSENQNNK